jgi:hypothetical protein
MFLASVVIPSLNGSPCGQQVELTSETPTCTPSEIQLNPGRLHEMRVNAMGLHQDKKWTGR